jgi:thiol-disulfide isomerase/thioredoxin
MKRLVTLICLAWLASTPVHGNTTDSPLALVTPAGLRTALDELQGEVVLINFWATWCGPCLKEIPVLLELEDELAEQGFTLVAVSLDDPASGTTVVQPFMREWFPEFRSYLGKTYDMDEMVSVLDGGWNQVLPTTYLLDRDGTVAVRLQGSYTQDEFVTAIKPLL